MSAVTTSTQLNASPMPTVKPSFLGMIRGELLKITRMWLTWIMFVLLLGATTLPYLIQAANSDDKTRLAKDSLHFMYDLMYVDLGVTRVFTGFFLIILTAYVLGQEFQFGTIRILLARGLGRVQLLLAKLCALALVALALLVISLLLHAILTSALLLLLQGNLQALNNLTSTFWSNTWLYLLTVLISMGATILMATTMTMLCRSLALGMTLAVAWFAIDNIGLEFLYLAYRATHSQFWLNVTAYLLGPNLNVMPEALLPANIAPRSIGISPMVKVDGPHTLWIALAYSLVFAAISLFITWKRDVKE